MTINDYLSSNLHQQFQRLMGSDQYEKGKFDK